jgi:hypothetical protein
MPEGGREPRFITVRRMFRPMPHAAMSGAAAVLLVLIGAMATHAQRQQADQVFKGTLIFSPEEEAL